MGFGFGIIGCGMISRFHAKAIADLKGARLVGCYSATPASADKFAAETGCQAYHDLDKMLADPAIDCGATPLMHVHLNAVLEQPIETLSKGFKRRVGLAQAIVHDPAVLILDEPTDGLDPNQKHEVRNLIRELGKSKAIVFSTHILEEVDAACTRAIIIDRGRIVANGTPEELRGMSELAGAVTLQAHGATREDLETLGRVEDLGKAFRIFPREKARAGDLAQAVIDLVSRRSWKVEGMYSERGELDEVFRRITLPDTK